MNLVSAAPPRILMVSAPTDVAGGKLHVVPFQGVGSEGGLGIWMPSDRFFWAGDYVQSADRPSMYLRDVARTLGAAGIRPERVAAQHLALTAWSPLEKLVRISDDDE
jgi:hypothetical protein